MTLAEPADVESQLDITRVVYPVAGEGEALDQRAVGAAEEHEGLGAAAPGGWELGLRYRVAVQAGPRCPAARGRPAEWVKALTVRWGRLSCN